MEIVNRINEIVRDCLHGQKEGALLVEGVMRKFGFNPEKIEANKDAIKEILDEMPTEFHKNCGGGWSFLQLCVDKDGNQWGEHTNIDDLICLAIAADMGSFMFPREMWETLPGGMPYVLFDTTKVPA